MSDRRSLSSQLQMLLASERRNTPQLSDSPKDRSAGSRLAFVGNWQDSCPRLLLLDPKLEPVDIVAWQVIRIHAEPGQFVAFPAYSDLMRWLRVSRATIARAVTVLRLARWLPIHTGSRDSQGRFQGNVYVLQDEPLPLGETLSTDARYVQLAESSRAHRNAHVRKVADEVCATLNEVAMAPDARDYERTDLGAHLATRVERMAVLCRRGPPAFEETSHPHDTRTRVQELNSDEQNAIMPARVQDLNAAHPVQNINSVSSSKNIKTTTTLADTQPILTTPISANAGASLNFLPALKLTDSQQRVLAKRFERLPAPLRQDVLDEATARIVAKGRTLDPVRCEFDYIARLVTRALDGEFTLTDAGEELRRRREGQAAADARLERARAHTETRRLEELAAFQARQRPTESPAK